MRNKSPTPVFIPNPGPSEGIGGPPTTATIPEPPVIPRVPTPPLVDPSLFIQIPTDVNPPIIESPQVVSPPLPLVPWGSHRRQYLSMEQYKSPLRIIDNPIDVPLPQSLTPSPPSRKATPVIPAPWNRSPTPEEIPLPPSRPSVKKYIGPSSLDLIPLPWNIPPFKGITPQSSPPVASSSFLPEEPMLLPVEPPPEFPLIVSMTPSRTTPLLPKNPLTESKPLSNKPTPPEWKQVQSLPVTGKRKELSPKAESSPPVASSSQLP